MNKMPFSPFYNYDSSDKMDNDYFYMQSITPYGMSDITKHIIDECDRLEYDGSFMFDEYPDKNRMLAITKRIAMLSIKAPPAFTRNRPIILAAP